MKKILFIFSTIALLAAGCNSTKNSSNITAPALSQSINKAGTMSYSDNYLTYSSNALSVSIGVQHYTGLENDKPSFEENGNTIKACRILPSGTDCSSYLTIFSKPANQTLASAIKEQFLVNYPNCIEVTQKDGTIRLDTPDKMAHTDLVDSSIIAKTCPLTYLQIAGSSFFKAYPEAPNKFVYFNLGQQAYIEPNTLNFN